MIDAHIFAYDTILAELGVVQSLRTAPGAPEALGAAPCGGNLLR
jgi:hypothetical protein